MREQRKIMSSGCAGCVTSLSPLSLRDVCRVLQPRCTLRGAASAWRRAGRVDELDERRKLAEVVGRKSYRECVSIAVTYSQSRCIILVLIFV